MSSDNGSRRTGEKVGWIGGWSGGFVWLLILSGFWIYQGDIWPALCGLALVAAAMGCIIGFAPWKHPKTAYWKLLLPIYLVFFMAIALAATTGGFSGLNLNWGHIFLLFPILLPFATMGKRSWDE